LSHSIFETDPEKIFQAKKTKVEKLKKILAKHSAAPCLDGQSVEIGPHIQRNTIKKPTDYSHYQDI